MIRKKTTKQKLPERDVIITEEMVNHLLDAIENNDAICEYLGITAWEEGESS
jgi:hypothetical protein